MIKWMGNLCNATSDNVSSPRGRRSKVSMMGYHDSKCLKAIIAGNKGVGKTSFVNAYAYNKYNTDSEPFFNNDFTVIK